MLPTLVLALETLTAFSETVGFALAPTGVTPGTYSNATVTLDAKGRITGAASGVMFVGSEDASGHTNANASALFSTGLIPTSRLPGALPEIAGSNGSGSLTNAASPQRWYATNLSYAALTTNYTIPTWARVLRIELCAPGGPGASGRVGPAGTVACGGGGGGGGGFGFAFFDAAALRAISTTLLVGLGPRGQGGLPQTTNASNGLSGVAASPAYVAFNSALTNYIAFAQNGSRGSPGTTTNGPGGALGASMFAGVAGASASPTGGVGATASTFSTGAGAGGGGAGGGISSGDVASAGGGGSDGPYWFRYNASEGLGGGVGLPGGDAIGGRVMSPQGGAGGGGGNTVGNGGAGGSGTWGSGGGGGGGARDGFASGAGGDSGGSFCVIDAL